MGYTATKLKRSIEIEEIITVHYFEYMKDFLFSGESHDFWELVYVDKGELLVQADEKVLPIKAGEIIFHRPNEFHALQATGNKAPNLVCISFKSASTDMKFFEHVYCTLSSEERVLISQLITEAREAFSTPLNVPEVEKIELSDTAPYGAQQMVLIYLKLLLLHIKRNHLEKDAQTTKSRQNYQAVEALTPDERLNQILAYMKKHLQEPLNVDFFSTKFALSRSTIHAMFHKHLNCGPIEYFNLMKITKAQELIRTNEWTFTEIAYHLSYSSLQYFSRQFKKLTGMSPQEYANSVKKYSNAITDAGKSLKVRKDSTARVE